MSEWTVSGAGDQTDILHDVLNRVVGVDDDDDPVTSNFISPTKGAKNTVSDSPINEKGLPIPLNPADLTPSKDPLEGFNAWIRGQTTPASYGQSPTPPGASPFTQTYNALFRTETTTPGVTQPLSFTPHKQFSGYGSQMRSNVPDGHPHQQGVFGLATPSRTSSAQAPMMPNGTPMHLMGSPNTPYPLDSYAMGTNGVYGGGASYGASGGYGDMNMYDPYASINATNAADNIRGRVYETAKDQHGCRFLQRLLDATGMFDGQAEVAQVIMIEMVPHVAELMTDQYANFLVQKLFDIMPQEVRFRVAQVAEPYMAQIALTPHGTFSIQKMIETIATREEMKIVQGALSQDVVRLVKDVHGNHVIQKVLQRFEHPDKQFIYDAMANDCVPIATNKQGCCVLQRCLEFASPEQRTQLVKSVVDGSHLLVQDPFGNYVVQYVLEANEMAVNDAIGKMLLPSFMALCMNKFSSNVIEKILRLISNPVRDEFVQQLKDPAVLTRLLQDDYGNYVVQTALNVSSPAQADQLVQLIRPQMHLIRNAPYAKKLEAKMDVVARKQRGARHGGHFGPRSMDSPVSTGTYSSPPSSIQSSPAHHIPGAQPRMNGQTAPPIGASQRPPSSSGDTRPTHDATEAAHSSTHNNATVPGGAVSRGRLWGAGRESPVTHASEPAHDAAATVTQETTTGTRGGRYRGGAPPAASADRAVPAMPQPASPNARVAAEPHRGGSGKGIGRRHR